MKEALSEFVFVYGTLKRGKSAHKFLKDCEDFGCHAVKGTMYGVNGVSYPMIKLSGDSLIHGEIYEVSEETLKVLDRYEGHPHHYKRIETLMLDPGGDSTEAYAWVYEYQGSVEGLDVITSGVF